MKVYRCDLHIHTCLSPCGSLEMHPQAIVRTAIARGLDIIAICDHNASENVKHVQAAAKGTRLMVIPGMELCSREEVHVVALLPDTVALSRLQNMVYRLLPGTNTEDLFGCQPEVNERGEVEGFNAHLLIGATGLGLHDAVDGIHRCGGLAIAAHVDRPSFSVISQLGFVPPEVAFDALEISTGTGADIDASMHPAGLALIRSSDAHFIADIGRNCTAMRLAAAGLEEIAMALRRQGGRGIVDA